MGSSTPQDVQVIIVGAGLSGLRAATELHNAGLSYVVLEAMDRVGGKTLSMATGPDGSGPVDMGAAWINDSNQSEMIGLAKKFGFDLVVQRAEGSSIYQEPQGKFVQIPYGLPMALTPEQIQVLEGVMMKLGQYIERSNIENPHLGPDAKMLDSTTIAEFVDREIGNETASKLVVHLTRGLLGVEPDEISALYLVDYIKSGTGLQNIMSDLQHGGQYLRNRQGNQTFSKKLAVNLNHNSVKVSTAVSAITQTKDGCVVDTTDSQRFKSKKVIISVPTPFYSSINFEPALPQAKRDLGSSTKLGYFSKTVLVFSKPWWREAGLSGTVISEAGPISFTRDTCSPEDGQYSITCFHVGKPGRAWGQLSAEERRSSVLAHFREAFSGQVKEIPEPINVLEKDWIKDPWAQGGPTPVMMPGTMTSEAGQSMRDCFGNIHFVGTETSLVWKGYMEGAVRSGIRGGQEVIKALRCQ